MKIRNKKIKGVEKKMIELLLIIATVGWCYAIRYVAFYEDYERERKEKKELIEEQNKKKQMTALKGKVVIVTPLIDQLSSSTILKTLGLN